jgi:hypothetical protein
MMLEPGSRVLTFLVLVAAAMSTCASSVCATAQADKVVQPYLVTPGQAADAWPPVLKEDLVLKENPSDPGSAAMILERQVYTDDEKRIQTEFQRIKVLTEAGRAYADVEIKPTNEKTSGFRSTN